MSFKVFKNTVLLFVLILISCGSGNKSEDGSAKLEVNNPAEKEIIVGANRVSEYLPLLKGKRVGIVANQTSVIFTLRQAQGTNSYTHLVDSLVALSINITKVFSN